MKKLFLFCCMTAMSFAATAQSKSGILILPDQYKTQWNISAGVSFNGVAGPNKLTQKAKWEDGDWDGSFPPLTGFDISIGFDKSYGKSPLYGGLYINFGSAGYKTKATKSNDSPYTSSSGVKAGNKNYTEETNTLSMYNVSISPTLIGYKYKINNSMMASAHLGGFASYDLFGKAKYDYYHHVYYYYDGSQKNNHENNETKISDIENLRKFDAGLNLGVGFHYGHFNIDFTWMRGFIPIMDGGDETIKIGKETRTVGNLYDNNFRISIGFTF